MKVKYEFEDIDTKIIKTEREFTNERHYLMWKRLMTQNSKFIGRKFNILKEEK